MEICFAILTISDRSSRGERADTSGPALARIVTDHGWQVNRQALVPDDFNQIRDTLAAWADDRRANFGGAGFGGTNTGRAGSVGAGSVGADPRVRPVDVILTTGGTGFSPRDVTPEATLAVIERLAPGLAEAMRTASLQVTPHAMLSRAIAGIRRQTLIVNLPGSPKAAVENLNVILPAIPHAVQLLRQDPDSEAGHPINL